MLPMKHPRDFVIIPARLLEEIGSMSSRAEGGCRRLLVFIYFSVFPRKY